MSPLVLVVGGLITWRISLMIVREAGPLAVFTRFRAYLASKQKRSGGMFDMVSCVSCMSIHIGAITALWVAQDVFHWIAYTLSFSAIACLTERLSGAK